MEISDKDRKLLNVQNVITKLKLKFKMEKENEFKKELNKYREHYIVVKQYGEQIDLRDIEIVAEHFYELGLKAKGE